MAGVEFCVGDIVVWYCYWGGVGGRASITGLSPLLQPAGDGVQRRQLHGLLVAGVLTTKDEKKTTT